MNFDQYLRQGNKGIMEDLGKIFFFGGGVQLVFSSIPEWETRNYFLPSEEGESDFFSEWNLKGCIDL